MQQAYSLRQVDLCNNAPAHAEGIGRRPLIHWETSEGDFFNARARAVGPPASSLARLASAACFIQQI